MSVAHSLTYVFVPSAPSPSFEPGKISKILPAVFLVFIFFILTGKIKWHINNHLLRNIAKQYKGKGWAFSDSLVFVGLSLQPKFSFLN